MMNLSNIKPGISDFMQSRSKDTIGRHQIIVYLLHSAMVIIVVSIQLLGLGGSQEVLPKTMSAIHLVTCLTVLSLWFSRRLTIPVAFSFVALVAQATIVCRFVYFAHVRPYNFLQLILINQITSLLAVMFLVMCFVKYTPFVVTAISLVAYGSVAVYLREPSLSNVFFFFIAVQFFLCVLGEMLRRNVRHVQTENTDLHRRETSLMRAVRLNEREIEAYLRMSSNANPTSEDTSRLFRMLRPKSQHNLINAVRQHLKNHLMDDDDLGHLFPMLTKAEVDVCSLIVQGKTMSEIGQLLGKSEKNIGVVRAHIRKKLDVPVGQDLRKHLMALMVEKRQNGV
jgi:hypothetical protein